MNIGYKATENMKCINLTYEVGRIYELDGKLKMCSQGFHFCKEPDDVFNHYPYNKDFVLIEIEVLGDIIDEGNKSVTNKFRVLRVIPEEEYSKELKNRIPIKKYDKNNNLIYFKDSKGDELWQEYDENNNMIHHKDSNGFEKWCKYDYDGTNMTLLKSSQGYSIEYIYDKNGNKTLSKGSKGFSEEKIYDDDNNMISYKNSNGREYSIIIE